MSTIEEVLKCPLQFCSTQVLGACLPNEPENATYLGSLSRRVYSVAIAAVFACGSAVSTPFWLAGDLVEWIREGDKQFQDGVNLPAISRDEVSLDPAKTEMMGFSVSTYQNTSDKDFCKNSDWGEYSDEHFKGEKAHLAPGQGVDVLTKAGMKTAADAALRANSNTIRFSVEWADVLNEDGSFNDVAMQRYVETAGYFKDRGLTPIVSLHHFVTPLGESGRSLFETHNGIDKFVQFSAYAYEKLSDHVSHFVTFNEANVNAVENYILGDFPAAGKGNFWMSAHVTRNMLEAHKRVYERLHDLAGENPLNVGMTHQALRFIPSSRWNYIARITSFVFTYAFHESFMQWAEKNTNSLDFLGVQYYTAPLLGGYIPDSTCRENEEMVESMRFRFHPQGILPILEEMDARLGNDLPLIITEAGTAGKNIVNASNDDEREALKKMDGRRAKYIADFSQAVREAQDKGINVKGCLLWTLFGNFEWPHGFSKDHDFGFIARDVETKQTRDTEGFKVLADIFERTIAASDVAEESA
ncbi:MAG: 6-phospho-beta-galactosidase [Chlamydiia bacterium]|nr:6-phospho-beta-galactosidase [Chlamydiia bacterium]